jgi:hypothetical protein
MKIKSKSEVAMQSTVEQSQRKLVTKLLSSTVESPPTITCECALWGSPCPHSFWSDKKATESASKAA